MVGKLTAVAVKNLVKPGRYTDGGGLMLFVRAPSAPGREPRRSWVLRYRFGTQRRDMGIGDYPEVSLAAARDKASAARQLLRTGKDPLEARRAAKEATIAATARTFQKAAEMMLKAKAGDWRSPKHSAQWHSTLKAYVYPKIGDRPVASIITDDVLAVLLPLWERVPETAARLRGRIEAVLDAAAVEGWRDGANPARWKGHLVHRLPKPPKAQHHPALPYGRAGDFMAALAGIEGRPARALAFTILTAARTGEVRGMTWGEVDLEAGVWRVPARRMKSGRPHRVPLSQQAMAFLLALRPKQSKPDALVFPGERPAKPFGDQTISSVILRMNEPAEGEDGDAPPRWCDLDGRAIVPHGFRSTFRVWCGETRSEPNNVVEMCLAHSIANSTEEAYARTDLLERRRPLMEAWGAFCAAPAAGKIVQLARSAS